MSDSTIQPTAPTEAEDLKQQCAALQRQMQTLLLALIIVSGTLSVFLWRQVRYARRDLEAIKPAAAQVIQEFNQSRPNLDAFVAKVAEYGRTHPNFAPIMNKYRIVPPAAAPAPAAAPKPAATPATKK